VNLSCQDALSGASVLNSTETITSEGANQSRSFMCTDQAGNSALASATGINIDKTAPTVLFGAASPAANANGWNKTDVSFDFAAADNLSGIASSSATSPLQLSAEGAALTGSVSVTDKAGNSATFTSPAVNIDKTAPTLTGSRSPAANTYGWNNTDVTVTFVCTDSLSGIVAAPASVVVSTEGANQSKATSCQDKSGNEANVTVSGINIDKTAPGVTNVAAMPNNVSINEDVSLAAMLNDGGSSNSVRSMYVVNNGAPII